MWSGFVQTNFDQPVLTQDGYRPGTERDTALGANPKGCSFGDWMITPIGKAIALRAPATAVPACSKPLASGFQRLILRCGR